MKLISKYCLWSIAELSSVSSPVVPGWLREATSDAHAAPLCSRLPAGRPTPVANAPENSKQVAGKIRSIIKL